MQRTIGGRAGVGSGIQQACAAPSGEGIGSTLFQSIGRQAPAIARPSRPSIRHASTRRQS
jgi:hypothetical protein